MKQGGSAVQAIVEGFEDLSATVRLFRLRPQGGVRPWTLGSHLRVKVAIDGRDEWRHYSLIGMPQDSPADGLYRIAVKRADPGRGGSRHMWQLKIDDRLTIAGPANHFELPPAAKTTLIVAGGIGITPLLGMALVLAGRGAPVQMRYAARDPGELVFADRLRSALGDRLQTFADSAGQRIDLDQEIAALPPAAQLLICGPVPLLQAAQAAWARAGRAASELHFETFGSSGNRPAQAFRVKLPALGLDFEVPADRSLLDMLAEHGVETLSDCLRGECGLCALDVVELQGEIDHRDVFLSAAQQRANQQLCACVSRVAGGTVVLDTGYRPDH